MGGLFGPKGQNTTEPRLNSIQVNQSVYGAVMPLVYGTQRIAIGLMWYGAFTATPHTTSQGGKGGGGASSTSFTYSAALMLSLCEGPVSSPTTIWSDKDQKSLSELGLFFMSGAGGQAIWSYLTTNFPAQAIPYDHTAYLAGSSFQLGNSAALPNITAEVPGFFAGAASPLQLGGDVEPATILTDYCTDPNHGCNFPFLDSGINGTGVTSFSSYAIAMGFYLSPKEETQRAAAEFIAELLRICNAAPVWSAGVLRIIPYADASVTGNGRTYTPDLTPLFAFTDDDYLHSDGEDPVRATLKPADQIFNIVRVEYRDRANAYNAAIAEASDADDIALNGERVMPSIRFDAITTSSVARLVAQLILQRQMYYRNTYEFQVRSDYCLLESMDLVSITDSGLGLANVLCRVQEVSDSPDDVITLTVEEMPVGPAGAPVYAWDSAQGYAANWNFAPGDVNAPAIFMAPQGLCKTPNQAELWVALSGPAATWGGCYVWMSLDGTQYRIVDTVSGPARHGTLTANLAAGSGDPDTGSTLAVLLANASLSIGAGATADADNLRTLLWVDGEIMAYRDATFTGTGAYNLAYLRRGKYGSAQAAHLSGAKWARLDSSILRIPLDPGMMGQTVYLKFQSFNTLGHALQDVSGLAAYTKTLPNSLITADGFRIIASAGMQANGTTLYKLPNAGGSWDASAYSADSFVNGARVSWRCGQVDKALMIALNSDPTTDSSYLSLDYAIYCTDSGTIEIYENGSGFTGFGSYTISDLLAIEYDGTAVTYYKNSTPLRRVARGIGAPLFMDSSFSAAGAAVFDLNFGPIGSAGQQSGNRLNLEQWVVPTTGFAAMGNFAGSYTATSENNIVMGGVGSAPLGPYGTTEPLWECRPDGGNDGSGGWTNIGDVGFIDSKRTYRSIVWFRRNSSMATGGFFHGCANDSVSTRDLGGGINSNPYFTGGLAPAAFDADKWYLSVGIIHGEDYAGGDQGMAGIWDPVTGTRVVAGTEFRMAVGATAQNHRAFPYYVTNTAARIWLARPRFELADGREPTIAQLLVPPDADSTDKQRIIPDAEVIDASRWNLNVEALGTPATSFVGSGGSVGGYILFGSGGGSTDGYVECARDKGRRVVPAGQTIKVTVRTMRVTDATGAAKLEVRLYSTSVKNGSVVGGTNILQGTVVFDVYLQPNDTWVEAVKFIQLPNANAAAPYLYVTARTVQWKSPFSPGTTKLDYIDLDLVTPDARYAVPSVKTAGYTFVASDIGTAVEYNSGSAGNFTVPPESAMSSDPGAIISVRQIGAGALTIVAGSGVTIQSPVGSTANRTLAGQYARAALQKTSIPDTWSLDGSLL